MFVKKQDRHNISKKFLGYTKNNAYSDYQKYRRPSWAAECNEKQCLSGTHKRIF